MQQTDQQMEQLSDLKGQSPKSSAKMPTSGLLPSPKGFITGSLKNNSVDQHSLEGRRGGGGACVGISVPDSSKSGKNESVKKTRPNKQTNSAFPG